MGSSDSGKRVLSVLIRTAAVLAAAGALFFSSACTDYERAGVNPRPFNEPAGWELNPYGEAFRN